MKMVEAHHRLLVFNSVHRVMVAEQKLIDKFDILLLPVPAAISADCGMVLRISSTDEEQVVSLLCAAKLQPFSIYTLAEDGYVQVGEFS
ncbi:MAG: DUF3343 domain-containing protein [Desulfuromonadaceae bacterium]|nr:DUF3343 domain-containing protein [Desulfuromonadaceae bacterium]